MLLFILNKIFLRPLIIKNEITGFALILSNSIPNFFEAVMGTLMLTAILYATRLSFLDKAKILKDSNIHIVAVVLASMYVISQELKFHNLGGNNIYDPNDLIASIIGLIGTFIIIEKFGFVHKLKNK
jgi:hypothetical protein